MRKFFKEFKSFISKGNVMDLAVGVIIGSAFSDIVKSLTDNIIKPIINCFGGANIQGKLHLAGENYLDYGSFISAIINFLIMAFVIFCMVKFVNKLMIITKIHEVNEAPKKKVCPYCKSEIPVDAVKCCHCTSDLTESEK